MLEVAHDYVREHVGFAEEDRIFADDINAITAIVRDFSFVDKVHAFAEANGVRLSEGFESWSTSS
jgi:histidine ammonia-lyase